MQKKCIVCGEKFFQKYKTQLHCSNTCLKSLKALQKKVNKINKPIIRPKKETKNKKYVKYLKKYKPGDSKYQYNCQKIRDEQMETKGYWYCDFPGCDYCGNDKVYENHHIVYRSEMPGHPELHNIRNIIRLCPFHHRRFHADKSRRYYLIVERKLTDLFGNSILCSNGSTETPNMLSSP